MTMAGEAPGIASPASRCSRHACRAVSNVARACSTGGMNSSPLRALREQPQPNRATSPQSNACGHPFANELAMIRPIDALGETSLLAADGLVLLFAVDPERVLADHDVADRFLSRGLLQRQLDRKAGAAGVRLFA